MSMDTKYFIESCDFISIDTSALMETDAILNFLDNYQNILMHSRKVIFVYKEVIAELKWLANCSNPLKVRQAKDALAILYNYYDVFRLEDEPDKVDTQIAHKHIADQRIIGAVTWYKVHHSQLFITNDKDLLRGIIAADQMKAIQGKPVYATSLSDDGELIEYDITQDAPRETDDITPIVANDDGYISGMLFGGLISAILISGVSFFMHTRTKNS